MKGRRMGGKKSKGGWVTVRPEDLKRASVRTGPHRLTGRMLHWPYCIQCGRVALKNEATRRDLAKPCRWEVDA